MELGVYSGAPHPLKPLRVDGSAAQREVFFFLVAAQVSSDYFTVGFCRVNAKARNLTLHSNHDNSI